MWVYVSEQSVKALNNLNISWHSTYTRKNDFPGSRRRKAVAFSISNKGYFGTEVQSISIIFSMISGNISPLAINGPGLMISWKPGITLISMYNLGFFDSASTEEQMPGGSMIL